MRRITFILLIMIAMLTIACRPVVDPSQQPGTTLANPAWEPVDGGEFNKFFPKDEGEFDVVYTQEKEGFAQAKLNHNGQEVATLSVSDGATSPEVLDKFQQSTNKIASYPAAAVGSLGTALLVDGRFQVQVRSKDASFTANDREQWLAAFDLAGIESLNK